MYEGNVVQLNI